MSERRLIDANAVIKHLNECEGTPPEIGYTYPIFKAIECFVEGLPTIDAVEVVRCKDCKHWTKIDTRMPFRRVCWFSKLKKKETNSAQAEKGKKMKTDNVNHPSHYTQGGVECIDALAAATADLSGIEAVCTANAIKYLWRWKNKNGVEDLRKAKWYIDRLIDGLEEDHLKQPDIPMTDGVIDIEKIEVDEHKEGPMTNADHIRGMSNRWLARWLCDLMTKECCDNTCPARDLCSTGASGMLHWLSAPLEEDF